MSDEQRVEQGMDTILFLGAEGTMEAEAVDWAREATPAEAAAFKKRLDRDDFDELYYDKTGRPYWLIVVTSDAPADIWNRASSHLRMVRL
jgi:hypothetical protein